jgi:hypothetical protein
MDSPWKILGFLICVVVAAVLMSGGSDNKR